MQGIGRATVYRTLDRLEQLGVLARVDVGTTHGYTVCDDERHHHHLVCRARRMVVTIDAAAIELEIERLAKRLRFRLLAHTLEIEGQCAACDAAAAT